MKIKLFLLLFFCSYFSIAQYSIDDYYMEFSAPSSVSDFYQNTYYNSDQATEVQWRIIKDSMSSQWQFSVCFPSCYSPGITNGTASFEPETQQYLNCHFYPNNVAGEGLVQMEITTNNSFVDTVVWRGIASELTNISTWTNNSFKQIANLYNLSGNKIDKPPYNQLYFIQYQDGTFRKNLILR